MMIVLILLLLFFFFFQAEDGIRDGRVTGVQTCALPISASLAERATMLLPSAKDAVDGPGTEENLALVQTIFGDSSSAIATLMRLVQTPFQSQLYGPMPLTPAYLRLDPLWDSLRADPGFRELYEKTQP